MPRSAPAGTGPTAWQTALRRLARRDHSEAELRRALLDRGHGPAQVDEAMARLRSARYLDDGGYAERFARSRLAHHGLGRSRIRAGLRQRGVTRATAEAGIAAAVREVPEGQVLDALARRYWRRHARTEPVRRLPRLWAFLLRRGFAPGLVRDRLSVLWPRWRGALEGLDPPEALDDTSRDEAE